MLGATLALAVGSHRCQGWGIVFMAAAAAALPDWDGLSLVFGARAYSSVHRVWGHNLLAACLGGGLIGIVGFLCQRSLKVKRKIELLLNNLDRPKSTGDATNPPLRSPAWAVWIAVGVLAGLSHLPTDVIYGGSAGSADWPVPLLWPFASGGWSVPILGWGDLGPTLIFIVTMFALARWPRRAQLVACLTLLLASGYVGIRWAVA